MAVDEGLYRRLKDAGLSEAASVALANPQDETLAGGALGGGSTFYSGDAPDYYAAGECLLYSPDTDATTDNITDQWAYLVNCDYTWGAPGITWVVNGPTTVEGDTIQVPSLSDPGHYTVTTYIATGAADLAGRTLQATVTRPGNWSYVYNVPRTGNSEFSLHLPWIIAEADETIRIGVRWASYGTTTAVNPGTVALELQRHISA